MRLERIAKCVEEITAFRLRLELQPDDATRWNSGLHWWQRELLELLHSRAQDRAVALSLAIFILVPALMSGFFVPSFDDEFSNIQALGMLLVLVICVCTYRLRYRATKEQLRRDLRNFLPDN